MDYWIYADGQDESSFAYLLAREIFRYDVRASINGTDEFEELSDKHFKTISSKQDSSFIIYIGQHPRNRSNSKRTSFVVSTSFTHNGSSSSRVKYYSVIPKHDLEYQGCYLNDLIKSYSFQETIDQFENHRLGILLNNPNFTFVKKLVLEAKKHQNLVLILPLEWERIGKFMDKSIQFLPKLDLLKNASAVVVDNNKDSLIAALLNCPQILLKPKPSFKDLFKKGEIDVVNKILESTFFKQYSSRSIGPIMNEVQLMLKNHEHYASFLAKYQEIREILGAESTARNIAKDIVSNLEEQN